MWTELLIDWARRYLKLPLYIYRQDSSTRANIMTNVQLFYCTHFSKMHNFTMNFIGKQQPRYRWVLSKDVSALITFAITHISTKFIFNHNLAPTLSIVVPCNRVNALKESVKMLYFDTQNVPRISNKIICHCVRCLSWKLCGSSNWVFQVWIPNRVWTNMTRSLYSI